MKNHLIFLKTRTLTVHFTEFVRDFSTLRLWIMITFSAPTRRHSVFISAAAWLLTIDSWSGTLNLSGKLIAGCSELPKSFPGASPQSRSEMIFSDPSIYSPPIDSGHLLWQDRSLRCHDGAPSGILVLEGGTNLILQIVPSFWMHTFRQPNHHAPQPINWLSRWNFAPDMLSGLTTVSRNCVPLNLSTNDYRSFFFCPLSFR